MYTHPMHKDPDLKSLYNLCEKKAQVKYCHVLELIINVKIEKTVSTTKYLIK